MEELKVLEHRNVRVVTTKQLAEAYGTSSKQISQAFNKNKDRYTEGKHYFSLTGDAKRDFINRLQIADTLSRAKILYLWTERGTLLLAKSINTDTAWEAYERLVDFYFDIKQEKEPDTGRNTYKVHEVSNTPVPKLVRQNTGEKLPFYIAAATKEKEPDIRIIHVTDNYLQEALNMVEANLPRILRVKSGEEMPDRCELCDCCRHNRVLKKPISIADLIAGI